MTAVPISCFLGDILLFSSDLLTGKSIPVLVGITRLPVDQFLAGVVLSMGAAAGALFSFYSSQAVRGLHWLGTVNRLLQMLFGLFLSFSLLLSLSRGVHYERGVILSLIPALVVASQGLPQRTSTTLVTVLLSVLAYYYCMVRVVEASLQDALAQTEPIPRILRGLNAPDSMDSPDDDEASGVWDVLLRALQLFVLAFYACVQHAPTQVYCDAEDERDQKAFFASGHLAKYPQYALLVGLVSALVRVCVWYGVCFFQNNALHVMLENDLSRGGWDRAGCVLYSVALLYSASWSATQVREQVLPLFNVTSVETRLKLLVLVLALAALDRQRHPQLMFALTTAFSLVCLAVTGLTLRGPDA